MLPRATVRFRYCASPLALARVPNRRTVAGRVPEYETTAQLLIAAVNGLKLVVALNSVNESLLSLSLNTTLPLDIELEFRVAAWNAAQAQCTVTNTTATAPA